MDGLRESLRAGQVIPAHPLALTPRRSLDERHQCALTRYYVDAGAGGIAVGVHTTQFGIREHGLYRPVLALAAETARRWVEPGRTFLLVAGVCGPTAQACREAGVARDLGYHLALVSLAGLDGLDERALVRHCRVVSELLPVFGFYLQRAVGGRFLSYRFWRELCELPGLWAVKVAPFDRYATADVVRAVIMSGRDDVALYTGNDDHIVADLVTPVRVAAGGVVRERWMDGGLLGQWAVWTRRAVELFAAVRSVRAAGSVPTGLLAEGVDLTTANGVIFDAEHAFAGCIPGIHEVLRIQGLLRGTWCLDPHERLSPGHRRAISGLRSAHPELTDDEFVAAHLDRWVS